MKQIVHKILIVDDIAENIKVAAGFLRKYGYNLSFAMDGTSALEKVDKIQFDLILLDIMLPDMEGFEVCIRLKEMKDYQDVPVIFLTARSDIQSVIKGFESGGADYITKPFNGHELYQRVRNHLDLRDARKKLEEKNQHLLRSNATRDLMISMISHDLLGPISTATMSLGLMVDGEIVMSPRDQKSFMHSLRDNMKGISSTFENLLLWARSQNDSVSFDFKDFNISVLVDRIINLLQATAMSSKLNLYSSLLEDYYVFADQNTVEVIVRNLLNNALKFTGEGGDVWVDYEMRKDAFVLIIADTGKGMSPEEINLIFSDEHYSTWGERQEKGFGLGLEISRQFAKKNFGTLKCKSNIGEGSRFFLELPLPKNKQ